jgi:SSS family solute:Na+ symporter
MAGMAANVSSLNTVFTYDIWQDWIRPDRDDAYYLRIGRVVTVVGTAIAIGTAFIAAGFSNIMDYIQTLFSFFNVPLFAVFILGLLWKRMTGPAGWSGLLAGTLGAVVIFVLNQAGAISLSGQGSSFLGGGVGFALAILTAVIVSSRTAPKPEKELVGLVRGLTEGSDVLPADKEWYRSPKVLAAVVGAVTLGGYVLLILI